MMRVTGLLFVLPLALAPSAVAQRLDDAAVEAAIKAGMEKQIKPLMTTCTAEPGVGTMMSGGLKGGIQPLGAYVVTAWTNARYIAQQAMWAKGSGRPYTLADVPDEFRDPSVFVNARPEPGHQETQSYHVAPPVEQVVLRSKRVPTAVVQPANVEKRASSISTKAEIEYSVFATFAREAVTGLPAGDIDVVLITSVGERKCKIGADDRARLFR